MPRPDFPSLYAILDVVGPPLLGSAPARAASPGIDPAEEALAFADRLLEAGVAWLQLRAKGFAGADHLGLARRIVSRATALGVKVVVNDRVDIALLAGATGVHVGQADLPCAEARRLLGPERIVGVSTHDLDQALAAARDGADYIGFGPMFPTASKADALAPRSLDQLRAVRAAVDLPIVAIGGIDETRAAAVLAAGADSVAMIGALAADPDPRGLVHRLLALPRPPARG